MLLLLLQLLLPLLWALLRLLLRCGSVVSDTRPPLALMLLLLLRGLLLLLLPLLHLPGSPFSLAVFATLACAEAGGGVI